MVAKLNGQASIDDANGQAIGFLLVGVAGGLGLDLCAKGLLERYPLEQFIFLRSLIGLTIFILLARQFGGIRGLMTRRWPWHLLRTLLAVGTMFGFFYALARMPLIEALALGFTAPLMVTGLSRLLLGEDVGWRRWVAVVAGFIGVLIILRPGATSLSLPALACLFAAFCYACVAITARKLGTTESSYALAVYPVAGPLIVAAFLVGQRSWVAPDVSGWILFLAAGLCSVVAWVGIVGGYRRAAPALLAPFEYTALIGGALAGYLIWGEIPDRWVVAGSALIIGSGLFVAYRNIGVGAARPNPDQPARPVLPVIRP